MTASDAWTTRLYGIVPDPRLEAFLVSQQPAPVLPGAVLAHRVHTWGAGRVGAEVGHALGEPLRPVRWFLLDEDPVDQRVDLALVFDPPAGNPPSGWTWSATAKGLSGFARRAATAWLDERSQPLPQQRPPWAREGTGWFGDAVAWIDSALERAGIARTGPIEEIRSWSISCVLRAPTDAGDVFFKSAARLPLFVDEPALTLRLTEWWPQESPEVIATEPDRCWLLMRDFGPSVRTNLGDPLDEAA